MLVVPISADTLLNLHKLPIENHALFTEPLGQTAVKQAFKDRFYFGDTPSMDPKRDLPLMNLPQLHKRLRRMY